MLVVMLVAGFFSSAIVAQKAVCLGVVKDPTGAVIPQAKVYVVQNGKAVAMTSNETDSAGKFSFQGESAPYNVEITAPGFKKLTVKDQACSSETPSLFRLFISDLSNPVPVAPQPNLETANQSTSEMTEQSIQIVPLAKLSGHVQDRSGTNLAGADVSVKMGNHEVAHESTDANGIFSFDGDEGTYDVTITLQKYVPLKSVMVSFHAGHSQAIVMKPEGWMTGEGWEYGVLVQGGMGLEDRTSFKFLLAGVHLGKVLTPEVGSGPLKGEFEYAVEVFPLWMSFTPTFQKLNCPAGATLASQCAGPYTTGGTYHGVSITPIILRWNFTSSKKWMPWLQGVGGVIYTTRKYPAIGSLNVADPTQTGPSADTSVWNFTPQFGIGTHYFLKPKRSIDFSANAVHISSASLGDKNPGVNTGVQFSVGYTWWK